jgi:hypothetical protein
MILRCQRIGQRIHAKTASVIMGVESGGDDGLTMDDEEEEEEAVPVVVEAAGIGLVTNSRIGTSTNLLMVLMVSG